MNNKKLTLFLSALVAVGFLMNSTAVNSQTRPTKKPAPSRDQEIDARTRARLGAEGDPNSRLCDAYVPNEGSRTCSAAAVSAAAGAASAAASASAAIPVIAR